MYMYMYNMYIVHVHVYMCIYSLCYMYSTWNLSCQGHSEIRALSGVIVPKVALVYKTTCTPK